MARKLILEKAATQDQFVRTTVEYEGRQYHIVGGRRTLGVWDDRVAAALDSASGEIRVADGRDGDNGTGQWT